MEPVDRSFCWSPWTLKENIRALVVESLLSFQLLKSNQLLILINIDKPQADRVGRQTKTNEKNGQQDTSSSTNH